VIDREELKRDLSYLFLLKPETKKSFMLIWAPGTGYSSADAIVDYLSEKSVGHIRFQVNNTLRNIRIKMEKDMTL
jgi:hypothetical protein